MSINKKAVDKPTNTNDYVWVYLPEHPNAMSNGYIYEHRLVMERYLGRYLRDGEQVQHTDGNPHNNSIANLELWIQDPELGLVQKSVAEQYQKDRNRVPEVLTRDYKTKNSSLRVVLAYLRGAGSNI